MIIDSDRVGVGLFLILIELLYVLALSAYAWLYGIRSYNWIGFFHLVVAWFFPPFLWGRITHCFIQELSAGYKTLFKVISLMLTSYCFLLNSGLIGVAMVNRLVFLWVFIIVLWFIVPAVATVSFIVSCVRRTRTSGSNPKTEGSCFGRD